MLTSLLSFHLSELESSSVEGKLLVVTMLSGVFTRLLRFTTLKAPCLASWVSFIISIAHWCERRSCFVIIVHKNLYFVSIGGSEGLFAQKTLEITDDILQTYKNQGRFVCSRHCRVFVHYIILIK